MQVTTQIAKPRRRWRPKALPKEDSLPIVEQAWEKGLFHQLKPRVETILKMRYGLEGPPQTLEKIGEEIGVSRERIRQLEVRGVRKLKALLKRCEESL